MASDTKVIEEIREMIEEYACNPDDYDLTKTAEAIYELVEVSLAPRNTTVYSYHSILARSDKIGGIK